MDISGLFSGWGQNLNNFFTTPLNQGVDVKTAAPAMATTAKSTVPAPGTVNVLDTVLNAVTKIAGTGIGLVSAYNQTVNPQPQYVTGTPQVLNLTTTNPGPSTPGNNQVFNLPPNTISITNPTSTQGSQASSSNSSMMWLIIALLALVAIALMKGK